MSISIDYDPGDSSLSLEDNSENTRLDLDVKHLEDLSPASNAEFLYPVDEAVNFQASQILARNLSNVYLRNENGKIVLDASSDEVVTLNAGNYIIEISAGIKTYLSIAAENSFDVSLDPQFFRVVFDGSADIDLGVRSFHNQPETSITTSETPRDMMKALSYLGSGLKDTSPERSFPTLRGHPPKIQIGDELRIPESLSIPNQNIWIEVPAEYSYLFVIAPLAYYLGCELKEGSTPRIMTTKGFSYRLDSPSREFEGEVERVLKQVFFLDCLTRSEGLYDMPLYERKKVESRLDFDFSKLYHRPIEEQIEEYLSVPFSLIHDQIPRWNITAYLEGSPSEIQFLPYVIDDFGIVRTATSHKCEKNSREIASSSHFHRGPGDKPNDQNKLVKIETPENKEFQDSHEEVWLGEGMPIGLNKRTLQSYQNRLRRSSIGEKLPITVVCNDSEMSEEAAAVKSIYQSVQTIPTDVYIEQEVTTDELQHLLQERRGFFHYIGSLDDEGFHCANGIFDASEIEEVSIDTFFLNACTSYQQGLELIESGATGGIVSLTNVLNSRAVTMAKNIALLLNRGFSFSATLDIAQSQQLGSEYLTIGCNAQFGLPSSAPTLLEIDQEESNYDVNFHTYPTSQLGLGSIIQLYLPGLNDHHLVSNIIRDINLRGSEINELLDMSNYPVLFEGNLQFANEISLNEGSDDKPAIEEDALNPQSIETELVNVHSYPESYKESLCRRCAAVFESAHFEDISQEDLVTITQVAHLSEAIKRKYLADTSEQLQQSFLEKYTDHPLTSMVPAQEDSENLRPMEARRILRTRRDYLEEISQRAFGETDDEIIEELQWVYLRLIWERIDFTPHADSEVEILSNQTPTALETYTL